MKPDLVSFDFFPSQRGKTTIGEYSSTTFVPNEPNPESGTKIFVSLGSGSGTNVSHDVWVFFYPSLKVLQNYPH